MFRFFRHYVPGSFVILLVIESLILLAALPIGINISSALGFMPESSLDLGWLSRRSILYTFVTVSCMTFMGMYWRHRKVSESLDFILRLCASIGMSMAILAIIFYTFPNVAVNRSQMFFTVCVSLFLITIVRYLHYQISGHDATRNRVVVLGTGKRASMVQQLRRKADTYGIKLTGFLYIGGENTLVDEEKTIRINESLLAYVRNNQIDELVVAVDDRRKSFPVNEILECKMDGIMVSEVGDFIERQTRKIRLDSLHPSSMIFSEGYTRAVMNSYGKRLFDIIVSSILLILTLPISIMTILSIWIESGGKGSVLYKQTRVGKDGETFEVLKFRSMSTDAEQDGIPVWASEADTRVTKNGKVIRLLRIDEIPQLINVLKGEMSFVGPRPERPEFVNRLSQVIPYYNLRHSVKPGITGWAQISYPYGASEADSIEKLQYDLYYIKRYSLMFDVLILFQTAQAILWEKGGR